MKYRIGASVVDTERAAKSWPERRDFNGKNFVGRSSCDQWTYETLYRSRRGRYYIVREIHREGAAPDVQFVSLKEAVRWLALNEYPYPHDLGKFVELMSE